MEKVRKGLWRRRETFNKVIILKDVITEGKIRGFSEGFQSLRASNEEDFRPRNRKLQSTTRTHIIKLEKYLWRIDTF